MIQKMRRPTVSRLRFSSAGRIARSTGLPPGSAVAIVKSNGGLTSAANAARYPVHLIESGPAAGVIATAALGAAEAMPDLIAFDMGGTTAKVGVIQKFQPRLSTEFHADRFVDGRDVGGYPIKSPVIDLIEIGAGGGSIAWIDRFGVLKVGPESAGADPGPACYGRGGERPTVTDAHVALGHIAADGFGSEDLEIQADIPGVALDQFHRVRILKTKHVGDQEDQVQRIAAHVDQGLVFDLQFLSHMDTDLARP